MSIYLAVFKVMNLPTPRLTNWFFKYHYKLIYLNILDVFHPINNFSHVNCTCLWSERAPSNFLLSPFETSLVSYCFLASGMTGCHTAYFLPHIWASKPYLMLTLICSWLITVKLTSSHVYWLFMFALLETAFAHVSIMLLHFSLTDLSVFI